MEVDGEGNEGRRMAQLVAEWVRGMVEESWSRIEKNGAD
jgi:hypothetical protein